jgi:hypothetical protein
MSDRPVMTITRSPFTNFHTLLTPVFLAMLSQLRCCRTPVCVGLARRSRNANEVALSLSIHRLLDERIPLCCCCCCAFHCFVAAHGRPDRVGRPSVSTSATWMPGPLDRLIASAGARKQRAAGERAHICPIHVRITVSASRVMLPATLQRAFTHLRERSLNQAALK